MSERSEIAICLHDDALEFLSYPYPPSRLYPSGKLTLDQVKEINLDMAPPQVQTLYGEILFLPATCKEELQQWAQKNELPIISRLDVWDLLLEPFLDTEFRKEDQERTLRLLEECGISRDESASLRQFVSQAMMDYNFTSMLWDWCHLGLSDVLDAFHGHLAGRKHRLPSDEYESFYWRAMGLATRGKIINRESNDGQ